MGTQPVEEAGARTWMRMVPGPREKEEKVARGQYSVRGPGASVRLEANDSSIHCFQTSLFISLLDGSSQ